MKTPKIRSGFVFFCALLLLSGLVLTGCDLFLNKPENDLEKEIDEAVAWGNATRLDVLVDFPEGWGPVRRG
jgi:hypothetical protein